MIRVSTGTDQYPPSPPPCDYILFLLIHLMDMSHTQGVVSISTFVTDWWRFLYQDIRIVYMAWSRNSSSMNLTKRSQHSELVYIIDCELLCFSFFVSTKQLSGSKSPAQNYHSAFRQRNLHILELHHIVAMYLHIHHSNTWTRNVRLKRFLTTVRHRYNAVDFLPNPQPVLARYRIYFVGSNSHLYSVSAIAMIYAKSCFIAQGYNGTRLYVILWK